MFVVFFILVHAHLQKLVKVLNNLGSGFSGRSFQIFCSVL